MENGASDRNCCSGNDSRKRISVFVAKQIPQLTLPKHRDNLHNRRRSLLGPKPNKQNHPNPMWHTLPKHKNQHNPVPTQHKQYPNYPHSQSRKLDLCELSSRKHHGTTQPPKLHGPHMELQQPNPQPRRNNANHTNPSRNRRPHLPRIPDPKQHNHLQLRHKDTPIETP